MRLVALLALSFITVLPISADEPKPAWPNPGAETPGTLSYLFVVTGFLDFVDPSGKLLASPTPEDVQHGTIKKLDLEGKRITITVGDKNVDLGLTDDRLAKSLTAKPKDFNEGTEVGFIAGADKDGKPVLHAIGLPAGRVRCLVTEYGLDPTVMVVVRGYDVLESPATVKLLQDLDAAVSKYFLKRLHAFVVVIDPEVKDVIKDDVPRYLLRKKIDSFARDEKNKLNGSLRVPLCICSDEQMAKFPLDKDAALTLVFNKNHRVGLSKTLAKDAKEEDVEAAVKEGVAKIVPTK